MMNDKNEKNNLKNDLPIRQVMADMKDDLYAIVNPELNALEDFAKSLYLRVLGTVIQYGNEPSDLQSLYFKRIVKGMTEDESPEDIMKRALEISAKDIREFVDYLEDKPARFYFALDAAVLTALGGGSQASCEYLAELLEVTGIGKQELRCIALIAKSIVTQQASFYDEAKPLLLEDLAEVSFLPYIKNYYAGAVVDSAYAKVFSAHDKALSAEIKYPLTYTERKVTFRNLLINVGECWSFNGCETVIFENCDLVGSCFDNCNVTGRDRSLNFDGCNRVVFSHCRFADFRIRPICFTNFSICKELSIKNCEFSNCIMQYDSSDGDNRYAGGIVLIMSYDFLKAYQYPQRTGFFRPFVMTDCVFSNCGTCNQRSKYLGCGPSCCGIIANGIGTVNNCKFLNCSIYLGYIGDAYRYKESPILFGQVGSQSNNEFPGCQLYEYLEA